MEPSGQETIREFQERRAYTFRRCRLWLAMTIIGFAGTFAFNKRLDDGIVFLFFIMSAVGICVLTFVVKKHYRCPECEEVVWEFDGVPIDPRECPHCHAILKKAGARMGR